MVQMGFPHSSVSKESACNAGDLGLIPVSGRSPGEGTSNPLQHSCLENPMDRGAWRATVHGVARVKYDLATKPPYLNRLVIFPFSRWCSGKEFACQCRRCTRQVRSLEIVKTPPWRREQLPTPVSLPVESHGQRSLEGYSPWGRKELDMTEHTHLLAPVTLSKCTIGDMVQARQWHPTPVLLPGKSHGWRSLVGCSPWGR